MFKKLLQLKTFLIVCLLAMVGTSNAWAQDESVTFSSQGYTDAQEISSYSGTNFSVTFAKGTNNNAPKYYNSGTAIRCYGGNTITVSSSTKTIASVQLSFGSKDGSNAITASVGDYSQGEWKGSANSVTFTIGGSSGNRRIAGISVTYEAGGTSTLTDNDLALTGAPVALNFDLYNNDTPRVINYTTSSTGAVTVSGGTGYVNTTVDETNKTITVTPVKITPSAQTITVSQAADGTYYAGTKTFTVNITDSTPFSGGDVTFEGGTDVGSTSVNGTPDEVTKSVVTVSSTNAAFATAQYRFYKNSQTTISTTSGNITKIVFTDDDSSNPCSNLSTTTGNYKDNTWTGNAKSVSFSASAQARAKKIVVTITSADAVAEPVISGTISFLENTEVTIAAEDGATIYYTTDGNDPTTSSTQYTAPFTLSATTTVKAIAVKDGKNSAIAEVAFTKVSPMTVAQALDATPESGNSDNVYVRGIVSAFYGDAAGIAEDQYHRYYISDDGTSTNQLLVFNGKGLNNVAFSSDDDLRIGDQVVITGQLTTYKDTKEFAKDNYIISLITKANPEISYSKTEYNVTLGGSFEAPSLANPNNLAVTYSISGDEGVASVDESTGAVTLGSEEGTVTITASFEGNETYRAGSASYTLTVTDPTKGTETNPYTVAEVIAGKAHGKEQIYVIGYIVGEFNSKTQAPRTSDFTTDANIALADEFTTSPTAAASIPVALPTDALKAAWGCKTSNGSTIGTKVLVKGNGDTYFNVEGIKSTTSVVAIVAPASITLNTSGYATFASTSAVDFSETEGYSAWAVTSVNGSEITFSQITNAVAAGTGVLLKGVASAEINPVYVASGNAVEGNKLEGVTVAKAVAENEYYGLSGNKFVKVNPGTVKAGKALLPVSALGSSSSVRTFTFVFVDPTTGISETQTVSAEQFGEIFNLAGQRVGQPQKGVNIINGKKVLVK